MSSNNFTWVTTDRKTEAEVLKELAAADTVPVILSRVNPASFPIGWRLVPTPLDPKHVVVLLESDQTRQTAAVSYLTQDWPIDLALLIVPPSNYSMLALGGADLARFTQQSEAKSLREWLILRRLSHAKSVRSAIPNLPHAPIGEIARPGLLFSKCGSASAVVCKGVDALLQFARNSTEINAISLRAGIYLWHDAMDESHELAQSVEGQGCNHNGDYVHAILHRREPDYGNAKYWFRRVGRHPNFARLGQEAAPLLDKHAPEWKGRLLKGGWDPFAFVDFCEQAVAIGNPSWIECAERIQEIEMLLLLDGTSRGAQ